MRKTSLVKVATSSCAALLVAALWLLPALAQDSISAITPPAFSESTEKKVPFLHNDHNKKAKIAKCATCHHPLPGAKQSKQAVAAERRCSDCHSMRPGAEDNAPALMMAYHKLCQDCHRAKAQGPVQCAGCHKD